MDDAGVYKLTDEIALVQTVDFFSPIVNDPRDFGRIAAANSLSDVYAMGAEPHTAMNVLAYPPGLIKPEFIEELLIGGSEKLQEAGVSLVGGHTMEQENLFYGMSVSGIIHPDRIKTNVAAREGDLIILTKPLGTGTYGNAVAKEGLTKAQYDQFVGMMTRLNKYAAEAVASFDVSAMTDVTGFGLLGHSFTIAQNAGVTIEFNADRLPMLDDVLSVMDEFNPKGVCKTMEYVEGRLAIGDGVDARRVKLMAEAQTSGGLLIVIHPDQAEKAIERLRESGDETSCIIGRVLKMRNDDILLNVTQ